MSLRPAVVTNDQGSVLVDEKFVESRAVPAGSVQGGCFCCQYDRLDAELAALSASASPDVVFAEAVGSCTDLAAAFSECRIEAGLAGEEIRTASLEANGIVA